MDKDQILIEAQKLANFGYYGLDLKTGIWESSDYLDDMLEIDNSYNKNIEGWLNLVVEDEREKMRNYMFDHVIKNGKPFDKEYKILTAKTNKLLVLQGNGKVITDDEGNAVTLMGTIQNITNRKNIELDLKNSKERLELALQGSNDGIFDWNIATDELYFSPRWKSIIGYEDHEIENKTGVWQQFLHPDDKTRTLKNVSDFISGNVKRYQIEFRMLHKNGNWVNILSRAFLLKDEEGSPLRLVGVHTDVTELRNKEKQLKEVNRKLDNARLLALENEERYRILSDSTNEGVFISENDLCIGQNRAAGELFGYTDEEAIGKPLIRHIAPPFRELVVKNAEKSYSKAYEIVAVKRNGITFPCEIQSKRMRINDKDFQITVFRDLSERKAALLEIRKSKEKLENQNIELKKAKEKAEQNDNLKSAFLANISHEIRTPLNGILGFAQILNSGSIEEGELKYFSEIIMNSGKHLLHLIDDVIEISKIDAGIIKLEYESVDVHKVLNELFLIFNSRINELQSKKIDLIISKESNDDSFYFQTDKTKFKQVFFNLLDNAVKYTEKGHIKFGYHTDVEKIVFFVEDTGTGIPADKKDQVFLRFIRGEDHVKDKIRGTGLGLAISKAIVNKMNGSVDLASEVGVGSVFSFSLPLIKTKKNNEKDNPQKQNIMENIKKLSDKFILIAEDDNFNYLFLNKLLAKQGLNTLRAKNGKEAIDLCNNTKDIFLVLMDIRMPVMNGLEAASLIKETNPDMLIIAQTAYAMHEDKQKCFDAGCDEYISKPINIEELLYKISLLLDKQKIK